MVNPAASTFLFIGSERYLKENALEKLKASLRSVPNEEIDHKVFYGNDSTASQVFDHAQAFPLFSSKKLIVIRDFNKLPKDDRARLAEYIKAPAKSTYFVIDVDGDEPPKELQGLSRYIKTTAFNSPASGELSSWITKYLASRGKKIEVGAVDMLKELAGSNLGTLSRELEKVVSFVGTRDTVTSADVEKLVGKSAVESAFELGWAIGDKDLEKAMNIVSQLMMEGKRPHETVGLISWHLNRISKAKALAQRGETQYSVSSILRIAARHQGAFFRQVKSFTPAQIRKKMDVLLEADLDIKRTRFDPLLVLELAIVRLCLG